ncbi:unnamed protein product [Eretmochelys imbricata]
MTCLYCSIYYTLKSPSLDSSPGDNDPDSDPPQCSEIESLCKPLQPLFHIEPPPTAYAASHNLSSLASCTDTHELLYRHLPPILQASASHMPLLQPDTSYSHTPPMQPPLPSRHLPPLQLHATVACLPDSCSPPARSRSSCASRAAAQLPRLALEPILFE